MLQAFMAAYPWDLWDEGVDEVLARLQGEVGVTGLSVWAVVPSITQLRVRDVDPRIFRARGGVCFQPVEEHYAATRCKPVVADWLRGRDTLGRIAEKCSQRQLSLRLTISATAAGRVAHQRPQFACKNALADASRTSLCLANPDVQAYLEGLVADLSSQYAPAGISLSDYAIGWLDAYHEAFSIGGSPVSDALRSLLSTCFCESCRQQAIAAGVDATSAAESVRSRITRHLDSLALEGDASGTLAAGHESLAAYLRWRGEAMSILLRRLQASCDTELLLRTGPLLPWADQHAALDLAIPDAIISSSVEVEVQEATVSSAVRRMEWCVPESLIRESDGSRLVSLTSKALELGYGGIEFGNYGHLPAGALTAVSRAIRYARRS